jgi:glycosyltransferase involved in cell wall biosynthesis
MKLIIYMPAFNEAENIQKVLSSLPRQLDCVDSIQHLVIDDGSTDGTASLAGKAGAQVISHVQNRGVGAAFRSAVQFALENRGDILVGIDADRQFDPAEIPDLIEPLLENKADMIIGNRFTQGMPENMPPVKYWGNSQISKLVSSICRQNFQDVSCGYRAYNREALLHLNLFAEFTYTHESILSLVYQGLRVMDHPINVKYYPERKSKVANSILNYASQTSKIIFRVVLDYRPLRVFGTFGFISMLIGVGFELFLFGHYALTRSFSPYKSVGFIGLGSLIFGMLVLLIALVADMLNRLRINQDKILYQVKKSQYDR